MTLLAAMAYKTLLKIGGLQSEADDYYDGADEKSKYNRQVLSLIM